MIERELGPAPSPPHVMMSSMTTLRWNDFVRVYPVRLEGEDLPRARPLRLACPALRVGDPVQVTSGGDVVTGEIVDVVSAVVVVKFPPTTA